MHGPKRLVKHRVLGLTRVLIQYSKGENGDAEQSDSKYLSSFFIMKQIEAELSRDMEGNTSKAANKLGPTVTFKRVQENSSSTGSEVN